MDFHEQLCMAQVLRVRMQDMIGNVFESFFHDLMCLLYDDFLDVRTAGRFGDMSSDGLSLHEGKLYACYAPETPDYKATIAKFKDDLAGAIAKRTGQFETFVFVHNDTRGAHPQLSVDMKAAQLDHPGLRFQLMTYRHLRDKMRDLTRMQVEALLKVQLPMVATVSVGLDEMTDILEHLSSLRHVATDERPIGPVSQAKLAYSRLSDLTQADLRNGMRSAQTIERYYTGRIDVMERDEVAARFRDEYERLRTAHEDPEEILERLQILLAGERAMGFSRHRASIAILAYFFEQCDIFDNPPDGWDPQGAGA